MVQIQEGVPYRRNCTHLLEVPEREENRIEDTNPSANNSQELEKPVTESNEQTEEQVEVRRSGRTIKAPQRLIEQM